METEKTTDLSSIVYQRHPECQQFQDLWNNFGCVEYKWIKNKELIKHKHCTQVFKKYLECVIHYSPK